MTFTFVISSIENDDVKVTVIENTCKNVEQAGDKLLIVHSKMLDILHSYHTKICSTLFDENKNEILSIHS